MPVGEPVPHTTAGARGRSERPTPAGASRRIHRAGARLRLRLFALGRGAGRRLGLGGEHGGRAVAARPYLGHGLLREERPRVAALVAAWRVGHVAAGGGRRSAGPAPPQRPPARAGGLRLGGGRWPWIGGQQAYTDTECGG